MKMLPKCLGWCAAALLLNACGVETLTAAGTAAVMKKEEAQVRQQQYNNLQKKIDEVQKQQAQKDRAAREALGMPATNDSLED